MNHRRTPVLLLQQQQHGILNHRFKKHWCHDAAPVITRCFATSSSRRRRRRPKALTSSIDNTLPTTRDRLRQVIERNTLPSRVEDPRQTVNKMVSVAVQRLTWLQTSIYQLWNPDYQPATASTGKDGTTTTEQTPRPMIRKRTEVVMDRR
eukprot:scaffold11110_cov76-Amphora_coffeaeformis.AAC.1